MIENTQKKGDPVKIENAKHDDTDAEDDLDANSLKPAPPVPNTAPPPLPKSNRHSISSEAESLFKEEVSPVKSPVKQQQSIEIKKALLDNMKCVVFFSFF